MSNGKKYTVKIPVLSETEEFDLEDGNRVTTLYLPDSYQVSSELYTIIKNSVLHYYPQHMSVPAVDRDSPFYGHGRTFRVVVKKS